MLTPFEQDLTGLSVEAQLVSLRGCALCTITRDLDNESVAAKAEWKSCKQQMGVPVRVVPMFQWDAALREASGGRAPAVLARTADGAYHELLDEGALLQCRGSVEDLRGRMLFRAAALGLALPLLQD